MTGSTDRERDFRILIIGAGVAGLSLAALLRQQGIAPTVVEKATTLNDRGYMLGLYPLGGRLFHGLAKYAGYLDSSVPVESYVICSDAGRTLRNYDLGRINRRFGPIRGISRGALIDLLYNAAEGLTVRTGTTVESLEERNGEVAVVFSDGTSESFDLVIGADGLHSDIRSMILKPDEFAYWETGWGGWVFWGEPETKLPTEFREYWGSGRFVGLYPVKDRIGVFAGGRLSDVKQTGIEQFIDEVGERFSLDDSLFEGAAKDKETFFWDFHDCRSSTWRKGRVILLGDAAAGFLPTAGVGASMAMESAAALADELSRMDAEYVETALELYEKRHRKRVERAQESSRGMSRMMFVNSRFVGRLRDWLLQFYSVERLVKEIAQIMEEPA